MNPFRCLTAAVAGLALTASAPAADAPFGKSAESVNSKMVKLFGSGGFKGLVSYGTGILVSPKGVVLTASTQLLDTADLRIHLADGRKYRGKLLVREPGFDAALVQIVGNEKKEDDLKLNLPAFDVEEAAKTAAAAVPGDWVLAFTNSFQIATRDEPMSIQRGTISAHAKLLARKGVFEAPFNGEVFFTDAIINNPGSAGGALTTRDGRLLGMIGKEFRNVATDTWSNYAVPLSTKVELSFKKDDKEEKKTFAMHEFVTLSLKGEWVASIDKVKDRPKGPGAYHGIVFVPNVVDKTPAFVDAVEPGSPASKAGLKPDDQLVYLDGEPIASITAFNELMGKAAPGVKSMLEIRRDERLMSVEIEFAQFPKK